METRSMDIKTADGVCDTFVAYPEDGGQYPAVLFFMDAFGLRPYLHEMAEKLANRGFYVLVPNVFYRIRRSPVPDIKFPVRKEDMESVRPKLMPLFQSFKPESVMQDVAVFFDFLAAQKQVRPGKIGVTGYCMGGALAIRAAAAYPEKIAVAASFHAGGLVTDAADSPHKLLGQIKAELYIAHADNDQNMNPEQIERLQKALEQAGLKFQAEVYKGAAHGFTMADLPMYNEAALKRHWEKLFELLWRL